MFKNKLSKYIIFEFFKSYFVILISLSLLIWITQAARLLNLITESGVSIAIYASYVAYTFPKILSQLMIVSLLISLFMLILKLQETKELEIYLLSGIGKDQIAKLIIKISFIIMFLVSFFYLIVVPISSFKSREILANSDFSMINSLVKKQNFNSPLKNLTIFVNKNDNKGNIEKIYIFEKFKTIIAQKGRILNIDEKNYLELENGFIHEKNNNNKITSVKFEKTFFDFTNYQTSVIKNPKLQEQSTLLLIEKFMTSIRQNKSNSISKQTSNILYELNKRIVKPLFIPLIAILCCFILYSNKEKISSTKLKIFIFSISLIFIILIEIFLNLSVRNYYLNFLFYILPITLIVLTFYFLKVFLNQEPFLK